MKNIIIASHRRSGTHLTLDAIRNNSKLINNKIHTLEQISNNHPTNHIKLSKFNSALNTKRHNLIKTHILGDKTVKFGIGEPLVDYKEKNKDYINKLFEKSKIIYVYRDGRDVMVSLYNYINKIEEIDYDKSFSSHLKENIYYWVKHIESWKNKDVLHISYESFAKDYENTIKSIFNYLEIEINKNIINVYRNFDKNESNNLLKRIKSIVTFWKSNTISAILPNKGKVGDWENHFNENDKTKFKEAAGDLLIELGYESNNNW